MAVQQLRPFQFNSETAVIAAKKSHEPTSARFAQPDADPSDLFRGKAAARAREHIRDLQKRIDQELSKEKLDTKALRELGDTLAKFELVEQKLSGRASPGSLRPRDTTKGRRDRSQAAPEPEVDVPQTPQTKTYDGPENG